MTSKRSYMGSKRYFQPFVTMSKVSHLFVLNYACATSSRSWRGMCGGDSYPCATPFQGSKNVSHCQKPLLGAGGYASHCHPSFISYYHITEFLHYRISTLSHCHIIKFPNYLTVIFLFTTYLPTCRRTIYTPGLRLLPSQESWCAPAACCPW